ncbi:MAG: hypothetical protein HY866_21270 [Chloroflexi bacterium]|nr:hypothetical protein [Chloroflexota bacterium]
MFENVFRRLEQLLHGYLDSNIKAQPVNVGATPPKEVFPIPPQHNYCALSKMRREPEISLHVQPLDKPQEGAVYLLKTEDMALVQQWVRAEGFSPSWDNFHLQFARFSDHEGDYYFFSR